MDKYSVDDDLLLLLKNISIDLKLKFGCLNRRLRHLSLQISYPILLISLNQQYEYINYELNYFDSYLPRLECCCSEFNKYNQLNKLQLHSISLVNQNWYQILDIFGDKFQKLQILLIFYKYNRNLKVTT